MQMFANISESIVVIVALLVLAGCGKREISFANDVMPILKANCVDCHDGKGEGVSKSGLDLKDYEHLMQGTKFGPVVVPGDSISSTLYLVVSHRVDPRIQMPPHHDEALPQGRRPALKTEQIVTIRDWIDQGAVNN